MGNGECFVYLHLTMNSCARCACSAYHLFINGLLCAWDGR